MFEGIRLENGGSQLDLNTLPKNVNGEIIVEDISSLKVFVENGASYDENKLQIMDNNSDIRISVTDNLGNEIFLILKNLNDILLANNDELPIFEVFKIGEDGIETVASLTTIEDLQAAAAGGETITSVTTPDTTGGAGDGDADDGAAPDDGNPGGIGSTGPGGAETATFAYDISFSGDLAGSAVEDVSDSSGLLTNDDPHYGPQSYIASTIVGTYGTFTIDTIGNWTYILDDSNPDVQALALDETIAETFTVFTEGENGSAVITLTVIGTNDQPIVSDIVDENFAIEGDGLEIFNGTLVLTEDVDTTDTHTFQQVGLASISSESIDTINISNFSVIVASNGQYTVSGNFDALASGETAVVTFTYTATDDSGAANAVSDPKTVTLTILGTNDQPAVVSVDEGSINELHDSTDVLGLDDTVEDVNTLFESTLSSVSDEDINDAHTYQIVDDSVKVDGVLNTDVTVLVNANGDYSVSGDFNYLASGESATVTFEYTATDNSSGSEESNISDAKVITLVINGTNDQPIVSDVNAGAIDESHDDTDILGVDDTKEDVNTVFISTLNTVNDEDVNDTHIYQLVNESIKVDGILSEAVSVVLEENGQYTITGDFNYLAKGENATITFEYAARDNSSGSEESNVSEAKTVTLVINGTNDQPIIEDLTFGTQPILRAFVDEPFGEGQPILNQVLLEGPGLIYETHDSTDVVNIDDTKEDVSTVFTATLNTVIDDNLSDTHTYQIVDGTATGLTNATDANISIYALDSEGAETTDPNEIDHWEFKLEGDFNYLAAGQTETITFQYTATDNSIGNEENNVSEPKTISITLTGTNDQPVVSDVNAGSINETHDSTDVANVDDTKEDVLTVFTSTLNTVSDEDVNDSHTYQLVADTVKVDNILSESVTVVVNGSGDYSISGDFNYLASGESATVTFQYTASDDSSGSEENNVSEPKTVTLVINGTNDQPVVEDVNAGSINETHDSTDVANVDDTKEDVLTVFTSTLNTVIDDDVNDNHTYQLVSDTVKVDNVLSESVTVVVNGSGDYSISGDFNYLAKGESATVTFQYTASDDSSGSEENNVSEPKTVTLVINGTNDQPVVEDVNAGSINETHDSTDVANVDDTKEDVLTVFTSTLNTVIDDDVNDNHTYQLVADTVKVDNVLSESVTVVVNGSGDYSITGDFNYLASGENATVTFQYTASDDSSGSEENNVSEPKTVTLVINGTNDQPVVEDLEFGNLLQRIPLEDLPEEFSPVPLVNQGLIYETHDSTDVANVDDTKEDVLTVFTSELNTVTDDDTSDTHTYQVVANSVSGLENATNGAVSIYALDSEGSETTDPNEIDHWEFKVEGDFNYLAAGQTVTVSFQYTATDDSSGSEESNVSEPKTISVTLTGTNDQPIVSDVNAGAIDESHDSTDVVNVDDTKEDVNTVFTSTLDTVTDEDVNDNHTYQLVADTVKVDNVLSESVSVVVDGSGDYSITGDFNYLAKGESATVTFQYTASDDSSGSEENNVSEPKTVTLVINGTNDQPVVEDLEFSSIPSEEIVFDTLTNTSDGIGHFDDDNLSYFAQTFTALDTDINSLDFSFHPFSSGSTDTFHVLIAKVDDLTNGLDVGTIIFESGDLIINDIDSKEFSLNIDLLESLTIGDKYVVIFDSAIVLDPGPSTRFFSTDTSDPDSDNTFYHLSTGDRSDMLTNIWPTTSVFSNHDIGLRISYDGETPIFETHDDTDVVNVDDTKEDVNTVFTSELNTVTDDDTSDTHTYQVVTNSVSGLENATNGAVSIYALDDQGFETTNPSEIDHWEFKVEGDFNYLATGETVTVSFQYTATDDSSGSEENNVSEPKTISVTITGTNDQPLIEDITTSVNETVDSDIAQEFQTSGKIDDVLTMKKGVLSVQDDDDSDTHTFNIHGNVVVTSVVGGDTTIETFTDIQQSPASIYLVPESQGNLQVIPAHWEYKVEGNFNYLGVGDTATVTFEYLANDNENDENGESSLSEPKTITVLINGTNDRPTVDRVDGEDALVFEETIRGDLDPANDSPNDVFTSLGGTFEAMDEDLSDTHIFNIKNASLTNNYVENYLDTNATLETQSTVLENDTGDIIAISDDIDPVLIELETLELVSNPISTIIDGKVVTTQDFNLVGNFNALGEGESVTLLVRYRADDQETPLENNKSAYGWVEITVDGTNDRPVVKDVFVGQGELVVGEFTAEIIDSNLTMIQGSGEILDMGDDNMSVDYWTINHGGGDFNVKTVLSDVDPYIRLFKIVDGEYIQVAKNDDGGPGLESEIDINNLDAGEYILAISGFHFSKNEAEEGVNESASTGEYNIIFESEYGIEFVEGASTDENYIYESANSPDETNTFMGQVYLHKDLDVNDTHTFEMRSMEESELIRGVRVFDLGDQEEMLVEIHSTSEGLGELDISSIVMLPSGEYTIIGDFSALAKDEIATVKFLYVAIDDSGVGENPITHDESDTSKAKYVEVTFTGTNDRPQITNVDIEIDEAILGTNVVQTQLTAHDDDVSNRDDITFEQIDYSSMFNTASEGIFAVAGSGSTFKLQSSDVDVRDFADFISEVTVSSTGELRVEGDFNALAKDEVIYLELQYKADDNEGLNKTDLDEKSLSKTKDITIKITGTNDAPILSEVTQGVLEFTENDPALVLDGRIEINDVDDTMMESARVTISSNYESGVDMLLVTMQTAALPSSITRVEFLNGTLFIEGSATLSEYEEILESVAFINESEDPSGLARTITWQVSDGDDSSNIAGTILDVIPVNDAPIARNNQNSVKEEGVGSSAAANLIGNVILDANLNNGNIDSDVDNDITELSVTKIKSLNTNNMDSSTTNDEYEVNGEYGVLTVNIDGTYSYDLRDDWNATKELNEGEIVIEEFKYTITDNALDENNNDVSLKDSAKLTITITGTNDKPLLDAISSPATLVDTANYDTFSDVFGQLSGSDDDANTTLTYKVMGTDIDNLSATMTVEGTYGTLVLYTATGEYIYTPNAQAINALQSDATDTFMFKSNDGLIDSDPQTLTINITGVNDTPVITTNSYSALFTEAVTDNQGVTTGGDAVFVVDSSFEISDVDDVNMEGAVVEINNAKADDLLSVMGSLPSGISIDGSSTATMIILTGSASKADYELAIESIKFSNSSHTPDETSRIINIKVSDGDIDSVVKTTTINVLAQNDAPTAIDDNPIQNGTVLVSEDFENGNTGWSINTFELNFGDTGDTGIFMGRFGGTGGTEAVSKSFDFGVENAGKTVIIEFDMYEIDSWDADNYIGDNGVTEAFQVFINNTLHSSDPMATDFLPAWDSDNALDGGTQTQNNIGFFWQDEIHHYNIPVTLDASGQVTLGFGTTLQQFILDESWGIDNLVITSGNDWTLNTEENTVLEIDVLANDFDVDMDTLSISSHTYVAPNGGDSTVSIVNDKLEFDPGTNFDYLSAGEKHQITFDYTISDGNGAFDTATVIVDVLGTDDAPIATVHTDTLLDTNMKDDLSTSVDVVTDDRVADPNDLSETYSVMGNPGDSLVITPILGVDMNKLSAVINADGKTIDFSAGDAFDYLDDNESVLVVINYSLYDGTSATPSSLQITINGTNDKPIIADNQVFNIYENDALSHPDHEVLGGESNAYDPLENNLVDSFVGQVQASDAENDMILYAITHVDGVSTTSIGYNPIFFMDEQTGDINLLQDVDYEDDQQYILTIRVTDGNSGFVTKNITVNIDALNDNVVVANDDSDMVLENEGKLIDVLANDTDDDLLHNVLTLDSIDETSITLSWQDDGGNVIDTATWDGLNSNLTLTYNTETITITNPFTIVDNKVQFTSAASGSSQFDFLANDEKLIISVDYKVEDNADTFGVQYDDIGTLTLTLDGTNDQPVITNADVNISVLESELQNSNTHGEDSKYIEVAGTLTRSDLDVTDDYKFKAFGDIEITGANQAGVFTVVNATNGNTFDINNNELVLDVYDDGKFRVKSGAFNHLADGEEITMTFQYYVTDREGFGQLGLSPDEPSWSEIKTATLTITGTNDRPKVSNITIASVAEESGETISPLQVIHMGNLTVTDDDTNDNHTFSLGAAIDYSVADNNGSVSGVLVDNLSVTITDSSTGAYKVEGDFDHLSLGETATITFGYKATDDSGASNDESNEKTVTLTVTGTNDAPTVQVATSSDSITEGDSTSNLTASDTFSFADLDTSDSHTVSSVFKSGKYTDFNGGIDTNYSELGSMTSVVVSNASTGDNAGEITWTYTVNDSSLQFLAENETLEFVYTVSVDDGNGGSEDKDVLVTITGTNDEPTIQAVSESIVDTIALDDFPSIFGNITADDVDVDDNSSTLTYGISDPSVVDGGTTVSLVGLYGTLIVTKATGAYEYVPNDAAINALTNGDTPSDVFTISATDSHNETTTNTFTVDLTGINDTPIAQDDGVALTFENVTLLYENNFGGNGLTGKFDLTSSDDEINTGIPNDQTDSGNVSYTMMAWVKPESGVDSGAYRGRESIISTDSQNGGYDWGITIDNDQFSVFTGGTYDNAAPVVYDTWQQVVAVFDNSTNTYKMYLNGVEVTSGPLGFDSNTGNFMIGENPSTNWAEHFSGEMGNVKIFEGVVSPTEILQSYNHESLSYVEENTLIEIDVLANDSDVDSALLTIDSFTQPLAGGLVQLNIAGDKLEFDPGSDFDYLAQGEVASVEFEYTITDGALTDSAMVYLTVIGTNDQPIVSDVTITQIPSSVVPYDITTGLLASAYTPIGTGSPGHESVDLAFDDNTATKYLNFQGPASGVIIDSGQSHLVTSLGLTTANDDYDRDPISYTLSGSNDGVNFFEISSDTLTPPAGRFTDYSLITFSNDVDYRYYKLIFDEIESPSGFMQLSEISLFGVPMINIEESNGIETIHSGTLLLTEDLDVTDTHTFAKSGTESIVVNGGSSAIVSDFAVTVLPNGSYTVVGNFDQLAIDETATISFDYVAIDDSGTSTDTSDPKTVTITVHGTNDAVVLDSSVVSGDVSEELESNSEAPTLFATNTIAFTDLDVSDTHQVVVTETALEETSNLGTLIPSISENNDGDGMGLVQWDYEVSNADVQYLAEGEPKVETFTVTIADHTEEIAVGDLGYGVAARDGASGTGYMMYFENASDPRFTKHAQGADNFVAVVYDGGVWKYDTNTSLAVFTPQEGDRLVAELDFSVNTATMLFGETNANNQINGIDAGYFNGDLTITPEVWNGSTSSPAPGEFGLTGSIINVATDDTTVSSQQISITITGTNDRPVISDYTETTNAVEGILTGSISLSDVGLSDADTIDTHEFLPLSGVATTVTDTNSAGVGAVTVSMDINGNYSFVGAGIENLGFGESATVEFDVQVKDNSTASNDTSLAKTITVVIDGANDRPTLNTALTNDFSNIVEDDANNSGSLVSALLSTAMSDIDTNDEEGIAITSIDNSKGTWEYKLASGGSWLSIPTVTMSSAFLLGASDSVRFVPNEDESGTFDIKFKAWDQSSGSIAGMGDTTNALNTQFSINETTASISVEAVIADADYVITNDISGSIDVDEFALIRNDSSSSGTISILPDPVTITSTGTNNNDVTSHPSAYTLTGSNGDTDGGDVTVEIDTGNIVGTSADEILVGRDADADTFIIDHNPGADTVLGGEVGGVPDNDSVQDNLIINGSAGADTYTITAADLDDTVGVDGLNVNVNGDDVWVKDVEDLTINTNGGGDTVNISGNLNGTGLAINTITINGDAEIDASGLTSDHRIVVNGASDVSGGNGNDIIKGVVDGNNTLHGNDGDDKIYGQGGGGTFTGGNGDDKFYIQEDEVSSSSIDGGSDTDTVFVVDDPGSPAGVSATFASDSDLTNVEIVRGTNNNDMLSLDGQSEDLRLIGANGDDNLEGGSGNDRIEGGNHNDMLDGNSGDDSIIAGSGDDTINVNSQEGFDTINGGSGIDKVKFGDISMSSGDSIDISAVGSKVRLEEDASNGFEASAIENLEINTYAGDDVVEMDWDLVSKTSLSAGGNMVDAGENSGDNDILRLRMSSEEIATNQNTLVMMAMAISTGAMANGFDIDFKNFEQLQIADTTTGITYNIVLGTTASDNPLNGTAGHKIIFAKDSGDKVYGKDSADQLFGQSGNDSLHGENGDDILRGGAGNDRLFGEMGADRLYGDAGNDKLYVDQDDVDSGYVSGGSNNDTVYLVPTSGSGVVIKLGKNNVADDIETVNGTAYADTIEATSMQTKVTINGGDGDDIIKGGKHNDNLNGDLGNDTIWGNDGKDVIKGGDGADKMYGQDNDDTLHIDQADVNGIMVGPNLVKGVVDGGDGFDTIKLTETFDINIAQSTNVKNVEKVIGTDGAEIISAQHLTNPSKNIQTDLEFKGNEGDDKLLGGDGFDTAIFNGDFDEYSVTKLPDFTFIIEGPDGLDIIEDIEKLQFDDGFILASDLMQALVLNAKTDLGNLSSGSSDIMIYDNGKDTLYGGNGADVIHSGSGDDKIYGDGSSDTLFGGDGKDTLEGGTGNDVLDGGLGNSDVALYSGNLEDYRLTRNPDGSIEVKDIKIPGGNEGTDTLTGIEKIKFADHTIEVSEINWTADEVSTLVGDNDDETVNGTDGANIISVGNGANTVNAKGGSDEVHGGSGKDKLYGEGGNDTLYGYDGKDTLEGGTGNDVLDGGLGNSDVALYSGNLEDYRLTRNPDGSIEVKDIKIPGGNEGTDTLTGIEKIRFADHTIEVSEINWTADEVSTLVGDNDGETVNGTDGANIISVGNGANTVNAKGGSDEVHGGSGKDKLYGEGGNDELYGYGGKDTLDGSAGSDTLDGGSGNDVLLGGNQNDTIYFDKNDSTIDGGMHTDTLVFGADDEMVGGLNISNVLSNAISNFEIIDLSEGNHILSGISISDVISMTDSDNILKITGDANDTIDLDLGGDISSNPSSLTNDGLWHRNSNADSGNFDAYVAKDSSNNIVKLLIEDDTSVI